ncbi:hypothetical protein MASR2M18_19600 [Ignavibacteria bacterium]|nr:hypothetical protein [Bacteroidota bacterium]MCZ2131845.1 hypothetical protein [Bacteroidota bacterium]
MKISIFFIVGLIAAVAICSAQPDGTRFIFWDSVGQRVTITYGERYEFLWRGADPDNCIIRYIPIPSAEKYVLEVTAAPITNKIVKIARAIYTERDSKKSLVKDVEWTEPDTMLYWHYAGQKQCVPFGKKVNFSFAMPDLQKYYMTYELNAEGYCVQLTGIYEVKSLHFTARCQKFIVPDPSYVSITYDESVKREQIVWTPLMNGNWEVRIGTVAQGCISDALDQLEALQNQSEYAKNLKVDKSNYSPRRTKNKNEKFQ